MQNNHGRASGFILILILIVALIVAWLFVKQMGSFGIGSTKETTQQEEQQQNPVDQAQDVVDQINEKIGQEGQEP